MSTSPPKSSPRAGIYRKQPTGYWAFVPNPLPVADLDVARLSTPLTDASIALGRLDGLVRLLPNPDLLVAMYVKKEAVLSSQIEGTQASLDDVLAFEAGVREGDPERILDVEEVFNCIRAMNLGLRRLAALPLSMRLLREMHVELLKGVRGELKAPGAIRTTQNWIGAAGSTLATARFIPPPPSELGAALSNLEAYFNERHAAPLLIRCGVAHAQFETIHPMLDGNGRLGRLLVTLMPCAEGVMRHPALYLSAFFREHRAAYYEALTAIREEGAWEDWLMFFLSGVREVATQAATACESAVRLQAEHRELIARQLPRRARASDLHALLCRQPVVNASFVERELHVSPTSSRAMLEDFIRLRIITSDGDRERNRVYRYAAYLAVLEGTTNGLATGST